MIKRLTYRYHRFWGIMFITIIGTGLLRCDFLQPDSLRSKSSTMSLMKGELSSLKNANAWLNSQLLTETDLQGKVVLVQFCTYTCINWIRTLPYIRAWTEKYKNKGLVVIGVHTPEFSFEKNIDNIRREIKNMKIDFPIAIDNNQDIWNAFNNQYWPALYLIDSKGNIRHHQFGEGGYEQSEKIIQQLLMETDGRDINRDYVIVNPQGIEVAADWSNLNSSENYLGYQRTENFVNPDPVYDKKSIYNASLQLDLNQWAVSGDWTLQRQSIILNKANGKIVFRFHARDLHLVMGPSTPGVPVRFRVMIDGKIPENAHGIDVDENGMGTVSEQRLYQLIRQSKPISDHEFQIEFLDPGVEAFSFTFG